MNKDLSMAVNSAQCEIRSIRSEMSALYADPKHTNLYKEMGCKDILTFDDLFSLYDREGVSYGAINQISDKCFETNPSIVEGDESENDTEESQQEKEIRLFLKRTKYWQKLKEADKRRMVGEYACLVIQVKDGENWNVPLEQIKLDDISGFLPVWQKNITVSQYENDTFSEMYGQPLMWSYNQFSFNSQTNNNALPGMAVSIHHSRVIVLGDTYYGRSMLASGFNAFKSLEKVTLSGGEGVYKNAASHLQMNFSKEVDLGSIAKMYGVPLEELSDAIGDQVKALNASFDSAVVTQDAETKILSVSLPDLRDSFDNPLAVAAASLQIPSTIIIGMQTGERASQQDTETFNKRCTSRRNTDLTNVVDDTVAHLQEYGALPMNEFTVVWDSLLEASESEKLANAKVMTETNKNMLGTGDIVYSQEEIRVAGGYEAESDIKPIGEDE